MKKSVSVLTALFLMSLFFAANSLFVGCKKNVGVITSIVRYDVSGYVSDNESATVAGATVSLDGKAVSTTDSQGKYTISKILPGSYQIEVVKDGYTKGHFTVLVTEDGAVTSLITLKKLAPVVVIGVAGGTVAGTGSSGRTSAALTIPAGTLSASVQISVTTLAGNEAPNIAQSAGKAPGVIVSLDSSDPNITFPNGIILTFSLPFTHKPGDGVQVVSYNEVTNHWDPYPNAIVSNDGKTASLIIYHFSLWGAIVNTSFVQQDDIENTPVVVPYATRFEWQSMIDFRDGIPAELDPSFFYSIVESATNLLFSTYKEKSSCNLTLLNF
jgi:Carboxypeptidase regulatory-like domain